MPRSSTEYPTMRAPYDVFREGHIECRRIGHVLQAIKRVDTVQKCSLGPKKEKSRITLFVCSNSCRFEKMSVVIFGNADRSLFLVKRLVRV